MDDNFDELIDRALSEYSRVAMPVGLASRLVRHVQRSRTRQKTGIRIGALLAIAASVLLMIHPRSRHSEIEPQPRSLIVPVSLYVKPLHVSKVRHRGSSKHLPMKQSVFPMSSPLTLEEQALVAMVERYPAEAARLFEEMSKPDENTLRIDPIKIVPPGENQ